jgi:hypothetical protein
MPNHKVARSSGLLNEGGAVFSLEQIGEQRNPRPLVGVCGRRTAEEDDIPFDSDRPREGRDICSAGQIVIPVA